MGLLAGLLTRVGFILANRIPRFTLYSVRALPLHSGTPYFT